MTVTQMCAGIGCQLNKYICASNIRPADADEFENSRGLHVHKPGSDIFYQHDPSTGIYCVRSGHVLLSHIDAFEHETAFGIVGPGEILGYRSFFGDEAHAATARALTTCHICWHPGATIHHLIDNYPLLARRFLKALARDPGAREALLLRGQQFPVRIRLIHLLLILNDRFAESNPDGSVKFYLPLSRRDIAALLGTRAESVARAIKELRRVGVADFNGRHVTIPDQGRLSELARVNNSDHDDSHVEDILQRHLTPAKPLTPRPVPLSASGSNPPRISG